MGLENASQTKGPRILGIFWAFFSVSAVMVSARLYIRTRMLKNLGPDDYIIGVATLILAAYTAVTTAVVALGYGKHTAAIIEQGGMDRLEKVLLINYINFALGIMSFSIPKLAIAALLNRILNPGRFHRLFLWVLTGAVFVTSSICILVLFTMCDPPQALWKTQMFAEGATCRPQVVLVDYAIFTGVVSACVDLYLAVYPTVVLISLQMTLKKKLALCAALGLGAVACAMAIVKCNQLPGLYDTADSTYSTADLVIWTSIESNVIIMASCIPTLGPLYEMVRGRRSWSSYQRYYKSQPGTSRKRAFKKPINHMLKHDDLMTTNIGTIKQGSQDNILVTEETPAESHAMGYIHRTDKMAVEYEMASRVPRANSPRDNRNVP
ncbi:uncharacterized protein BO97DRAFT_392894 [Aspergillus homomorphus CBS 101889]|uniref:Rhodopsin domain-containing protein n=1 Tax=Aspergillus homomorphus (strain CBS 101889) TaxID=1450537 RepID=A0A395HSM2_ASPHC|nr:hypothetical protein BO97DRAFT_392894 [Aspergillus homomorphus CBS 101889]RAL10942.1 hypothetical protein BO97DRAFT_392894 [Aspergillus homomorphus CBS 101889]